MCCVCARVGESVVCRVCCSVVRVWCESGGVESVCESV